MFLFDKQFIKVWYNHIVGIKMYGNKLYQSEFIEI